MRAASAAIALALCAAPLAAPAGPVRAQPRVFRVGFILTVAPDEAKGVATELDRGLRELGYVEGKNLVMERRFAGGKPQELDALAAELVRLNVDVIVTGSNPVIAAVKRATTTIPVVMGVSRDPVGAGFVASLARPGGNITGLANEPAPEIIGKNLEFLKEAVPGASRVGLLWNPAEPGAGTYRAAAERAAARLGLTLTPVTARAREELDGAFTAMTRERARGVMVLPDAVFFGARRDIAALATRHRIPAMYGQSDYAAAGGLMSYGLDAAGQFRRAAVYVDRILKGARPGDLAVEQPATFELVINLKAAKAIGLTISPALRQRADRLIE